MKYLKSIIVIVIIAISFITGFFSKKTQPPLKGDIVEPQSCPVCEVCKPQIECPVVEPQICPSQQISFGSKTTSSAKNSCKGVIKSVEKGINGTIFVKSQYFLNDILQTTGSTGDTDVQTYFPDKLRGFTLQEIKNEIISDVKSRCNQILANEFKKQGNYPLEKINSVMSDEILSTINILNILNKDIYVNDNKILIDTSKIPLLVEPVSNE